MLMNLLPGLRDLRAPLAAGYLWLTGLWLLLADSIPSRGTATGVIADAYILVGALGHAPAIAILSFVAYVLGAVLSVDVDGRTVFIITHIHLIPSDYREHPYSVLISNRSITELIFSIGNLKENVPRIAFGDEDEAIQEWNASLQPGILAGDWVFGRSGEWTRDIWRGLLGYLIENLTREIRQLVTRLRVSSPPLFDQYDRLRGEAEFRLSITFPLVFIGGVLAWKWTPLWLLLLPGIFLITRSGVRRVRDAADVIAQAALAGYVTPTSWMRQDTKPLEFALEALTVALRLQILSKDDELKVKKILAVLSSEQLNLRDGKKD